MNLIRRAILSLALIAGIAPAFAQIPPPVPALPDTERRTSYSISASTCACSVGFQLYGDSTDVVNWLEVFVNGVLVPQSGGWTISSPTGPIATIPRPITDAVLTFTVAQTGTVQIVGARRPRRTTQFQESQPVPTRNFNQTFSDIIATQRELWDKTNDFTGRGVFAPPGETLKLLPALANRLNQGACFDNNGNLTTCVGTPSSSFIAGSGITFTGGGPTTISCTQFSASLPGCVPASGGGILNFLRADGTFAPSGGSVSAPQGRITLTSATPITTTDVAGATSHFVTPFFGAGQIPIYNGSNFVMTTFAEVSQLTTDSTKSPTAVVASKVYDIVCWIDTGPTNRCTRSYAWASDTSLGSGAGTAQRTLINGIWVNAVAVTNGPAANLGTIVGSVRSNASSQLMDTAAFRWTSNMYNCVPRSMSVVEATVSWNYTTATFRQANANAANQLDFLSTLAGNQLVADVVATYSNTATSNIGPVGIDIDSVNTTSIVSNINSFNYVPIANALVVSLAKYNGYPGFGRHLAIWKEQSTAAGTGTFYGTAGGNVLQSGIYGTICN